MDELTSALFDAMAFTLWALLEAGLLVINAICILHEKRFLTKGKNENKRPITHRSRVVYELRHKKQPMDVYTFVWNVYDIDVITTN